MAPVRVLAAPPPAPPAESPTGAPVFASDQLAALESAAPMMRGDELVQAIELPEGGMAIGHHQLYEYLGGEWAAYAWDRGAVRTTQVNWAVFVGPTLYVVGDNGLLLRRRDARNFEPVALDGLNPRTRGLDWLRAWATPDGERLYVRAGFDRLLQIELSTGHTRLFPIPLAGSGGKAPAATVPHIVGRTGPEGDELLLVMGQGLYRFDGRQVMPVASFEKPVDELSFAGPERVKVASGDEVVDLPLGQAAEAEGVHGDLNPAELRALAAAERREAMRKRQEQMAAAGTFWFPTVRVSPGAQFELGERHPALVDELGRTSFVLDLAAGVMLAPPSGDQWERGHGLRPVEAWFWPELGYSWTPGDHRHRHAATAGVGFGLGNDFIAGYYKPRLELGFGRQTLEEPGMDAPPRPGSPGWGARHGVSAQALWGTLGVELSHGMAFDAGVQHDMRVTLDVNLAPLVWAAILWATL